MLFLLRSFCYNILLNHLAFLKLNIPNPHFKSNILMMYLIIYYDNTKLQNNNSDNSFLATAVKSKDHENNNH